MKANLFRILSSGVLLIAFGSPAQAQEATTPATIPEMWSAWCARCHAQDGTGKVAEPTVTVEPMDFTDCSLTTPEGDPDWEAVISKGGPAVGLSSQMPAFGDFLTPAQITEFVGFIKKFCTEPGWPSGNLNLPRPIFAEKAFLENEFILAPVASHRSGEPKEYELAAIYERRLGKRAQLEAVLPFGSVNPGSGRSSGAGDVELGLKYALNPTTINHLVTAGFDLVLPTGRESKSLGGGEVVFEPYIATATVIGSQTYIQTQLKVELPRHNPWTDKATVYNIYVGHDAKLLPSTFTYGIELNGENDELAFTPQIRKGLSKSGALAGAFGVRIPLNKRDEQGVKWVGYLLWEYLEPVLSRR
jgi:hypothetical protein